MAADNTAVDAATVTLTASTARTIHLTGQQSRTVELVHHGNVTDPVYFQVRGGEGTLAALTVAGSEASVVLAGERLTVRVTRSGMWIRLISAGAARVTVDGAEK